MAIKEVAAAIGNNSYQWLLIVYHYEIKYQYSPTKMIRKFNIFFIRSYYSRNSNGSVLYIIGAKIGFKRIFGRKARLE